MSKIGILGYGEVGQAIAKFYRNPKIKDLKRDDGLQGVEILHVCIPWSKDFISIVKKEVFSIKPKLVIIHSTVALGTTKKLNNVLKVPVVHSPIRGVHPFLHRGVKEFVKYIGAEIPKDGLKAKKHLSSLGLKVKVITPSLNTEALKLWDTTQYGWQIVLNKDIKKWCEKKGADFNFVYLEANKTYNDGYLSLGRKEVVRPFLKYVPGKIGGHCVIPNCEILDSEIAKYILKKNQNY